MQIAFYDDTYTGPRWVYGLRNRPPGPGCIPRDGLIAGSYHPDARPTPACRHGTVDYACELTASEVSQFELVPVGPTALRSMLPE